MRTKIIHGIDDNVNFDRCLTYNNNLPNSDPYKLSENDFDARWLAVQPICSRSECQPENEEVIFYSCPSECENSSENYQPCMNCVYYGEFKVIEELNESGLKGMGGAEYIASLLAGYTGEEKEEFGTVFYENTAYPGRWIAMAPPLYGEDVDYDDGHSNDLKHEAMDVAAFLTWAAEPKMMARKHVGFRAVLFLILLSALLYATNKTLWAPIKKRAA